MACSKTLMVLGVLLLTSLLAEGDAQAKVHPEGGGGGGWGGGGWGGGGGGWGGGGGGWGGGGWGGGGGCRYRCGYRCCTPQEIANIIINTEKETQGATVGPEGYGGGGGRGGGWGGGGGGGGCRYRCGYRCCTPEETANIIINTEMITNGKQMSEEATVGTERYGGGGYGGGGGGGCRYRCGYRCCNPEEIANIMKNTETKTNVKQAEEAAVGTERYGGGGGGSGGGGGGGGGCRHRCGYRCCTPEEVTNMAKNAETKSNEKQPEAKEEHTKSTEPRN